MAVTHRTIVKQFKRGLSVRYLSLRHGQLEAEIEDIIRLAFLRRKPLTRRRTRSIL
jgi:hypothetical protein